ncbi:MAG TPA: ABC transporter substrate-binding protein [Candidatus Acidoferrales bacterium]|nr:ABC transporter substrate-binding protein [Candidatus Acidoferrales bacterium]
MRTTPLKLGVWFWIAGVSASAIASAPESGAALAKAKKEAEAKGFIFETNRDAIVAKAKKEGAVKVLSGLDPGVYPSMMASFRKKYPFLKVEMVEITGPDAAQRFIMELKSGAKNDFDVAHASTEFYPEYIPFAKKFDLLGMAEHGVLRISPKMIDPRHRAIAALGSAIAVVAYNKNLIPPEKVPNRWEDFLKPEFKGRKFLVDMRPHAFAAYPACPEEGLGLEWMLRYARGLREQEPIWSRGHSRALNAIMAGEYALHSATHYQSVMRAMAKDLTGALQFKMVEPVPVRLTELELVLAAAAHPYAALLFLEHEASPEGQDIIDKQDFVGSIFYPRSNMSKALAGKRLCVNGFADFHNSSKWMAMAVEAFGFPKESKR